MNDAERVYEFVVKNTIKVLRKYEPSDCTPEQHLRWQSGVEDFADFIPREIDRESFLEAVYATTHVRWVPHE